MPRQFSHMQKQAYIEFQRAHIFVWFGRNSRNFHTIFCGKSNIFMIYMATYHALVFVYTEIDAAPIFTVSRINAKIVALIQRPENWLSIDFSVLSHQCLICYRTQLYDKILARLQNMGAQLSLSRIFHPNPCARRTHPILGCVLRAHGFG